MMKMKRLKLINYKIISSWLIHFLTRLINHVVNWLQSIIATSFALMIITDFYRHHFHSQYIRVSKWISYRIHSFYTSYTLWCSFPIIKNSFPSMKNSFLYIEKVTFKISQSNEWMNEIIFSFQTAFDSFPLPIAKI